jgi:choice-of-anchor B domain-containing protein
VPRPLAALLLAALALTATASAGAASLLPSTPYGAASDAGQDAGQDVGQDGAHAHLHKQVRPPARTAGVPHSTVSNQRCVRGRAGAFRCHGVDLLSFVPLEDFRGSEALAPLGGGTSDLWGWTDPETEDEYVLIGKTNGTAFFRVTDPTRPVYLGALLNSSPAQLIWHDIKVYADHAFIVSESAGHGMRVFDLTRLRGVTAPQTWTEDVNYPLAFSAHNLAINEETGYAYVVGGNNALLAPDACLSGLHMVDISEPKRPVPAGCHLRGEGPGTAGGLLGVDGVASYIHDTQCVVYRGPDADHSGREICLNSSETHLSVVDVTDKLAPVQLSRVSYPSVGYAHQGWLTEDHRTFLMGDELDEGRTTDRTRTLLFDVTDLDAPRFLAAHRGSTNAIDHNMYVKDGLVYQSNYAAGLRVLDARQAGRGRLREVAFFDSFPEHDDPRFVGTWSNYPYFPSGTIAFSGIDEGLFLVRLAH